MRFACILAAYIKRRSNLVMLAEKQENIDVGELSLATKESLGFLSLTGAECTFDCAVSGKIYGKNAGVFYDFSKPALQITRDYRVPLSFVFQGVAIISFCVSNAIIKRKKFRRK